VTKHIDSGEVSRSILELEAEEVADVWRARLSELNDEGRSVVGCRMTSVPMQDLRARGSSEGEGWDTRDVRMAANSGLFLIICVSWKSEMKLG
jgi:hypothetical protein